MDRLEAIKLVFHLYLLFADLLDYLSNDISKSSKGKIDINKASIDELEAIGEISRNIAKEIVKARVKLGKLNLKAISSIKGIGPKSLKTIEENFII